MMGIFYANWLRTSNIMKINLKDFEEAAHHWWIEGAYTFKNEKCQVWYIFGNKFTFCVKTLQTTWDLYKVQMPNLGSRWVQNMLTTIFVYKVYKSKLSVEFTPSET